MSMCYLCDLCWFARPKKGWLLKPRCMAQNGLYVENKPIDYGRNDPKEICMYFEPKEGGDE